LYGKSFRNPHSGRTKQDIQGLLIALALLHKVSRLRLPCATDAAAVSD
jgi:hypothetical protein